ncbi:hypothetical protein [Prescottella agglutinans]|uniref:hypothetical protein n=1 Tax=Prescottella agglutinans TaxID=1644129 RepID=UPI003D97EC30
MQSNGVRRRRTRKDGGGSDGLDALFDAAAPAWTVPAVWDASEPWPLIQRTLVGVARRRQLDPVTTEVVRLHQARQHDRRLCKSLRNRTAVVSGRGESLYDAIDDFRRSDLSITGLTDLAPLPGPDHGRKVR